MQLLGRDVRSDLCVEQRFLSLNKKGFRVSPGVVASALAQTRRASEGVTGAVCSHRGLQGVGPGSSLRVLLALLPVLMDKKLAGCAAGRFLPGSHYSVLGRHRGCPESEAVGVFSPDVTGQSRILGAEQRGFSWGSFLGGKAGTTSKVLEVWQDFVAENSGLFPGR